MNSTSLPCHKCSSSFSACCFCYATEPLLARALIGRWLSHFHQRVCSCLNPHCKSLRELTSKVAQSKFMWECLEIAWWLSPRYIDSSKIVAFHCILLQLTMPPISWMRNGMCASKNEILIPPGMKFWGMCGGGPTSICSHWPILEAERALIKYNHSSSPCFHQFC